MIMRMLIPLMILVVLCSVTGLFQVCFASDGFIHDFTDQSQRSRWWINSDRPEWTGLDFETADDRTYMALSVTNVGTWHGAIVSITEDIPDDFVLALRFRNSENVTTVMIEVFGVDGSRWRIIIDGSEDWREYAFVNSEFVRHSGQGSLLLGSNIDRLCIYLNPDRRYDGPYHLHIDSVSIEPFVQPDAYADKVQAMELPSIETPVDIAIVQEPIFERAANAGADGEYWKSLFENNGLTTEFINYGNILKGDLTSDRFRILLLPEAEWLPLGIKEPILDYLKNGGNLIVLGGFAFSRPLSYTNGQWEEMYIRPNTPLWNEYGLTDDLALFHPAYKLEEVAFVASSDHVTLADTKGFDGEDPVLFEVTDIAGYSAIANTSKGIPSSEVIATGTDKVERSKYFSLLDGYDLSGNKRGSLLALVQNFTGDFEGSTWIISGVNIESLSAGSIPMFEETLVRAAKQIVSGLWVLGTESEYPLYYPGEVAHVKTIVVNWSSMDKDVQLSLNVTSSKNESLKADEFILSIPSGGQVSVLTKVSVSQDGGDMVKIESSLQGLDVAGLIKSTDTWSFFVWDGRFSEEKV